MLISIGTWWSRRRPLKSSGSSMQESLRAWVDTLLPAEPDFSGALALGVAQQVISTVEHDLVLAKLTSQALIWVDARAAEAGATGFHELSEPARSAIVAAASTSPLGSAPRTFFQATLDEALFHTYADPRAWAGLAYAGPPQPIGFLDYAVAPKPA